MRLTAGSAVRGSAAAGTGRAKVRLLRPDVAVVIATGGSSLDPDGEPDPERDSIVTLTAVRGEGGWRFASFQNTRRIEMPARPTEGPAERRR